MGDPSSDEHRKTVRCGVCHKTGHNRTTCVENESAPLQVVDDKVVLISELRERCDALALEINQYADVQAVIDRRVSENRVEMEKLQLEIARLRR
jgi:hypothetical protein